jgi:hypothetical protein
VFYKRDHYMVTIKNMTVLSSLQLFMCSRISKLIIFKSNHKTKGSLSDEELLRYA